MSHAQPAFSLPGSKSAGNRNEQKKRAAHLSGKCDLYQSSVSSAFQQHRQAVRAQHDLATTS